MNVSLLCILVCVFDTFVFSVCICKLENFLLKPNSRNNWKMELIISSLPSSSCCSLSKLHYFTSFFSFCVSNNGQQKHIYQQSHISTLSCPPPTPIWDINSINIALTLENQTDHPPSVLFMYIFQVMDNKY